MNDVNTTGWAMPGAARKFHWFRSGEIVSACGRWMYSGERQPDSGVLLIATQDDCLPCMKERKKQVTAS